MGGGGTGSSVCLYCLARRVQRSPDTCAVEAEEITRARLPSAARRRLNVLFDTRLGESSVHAFQPSSTLLVPAVAHLTETNTTRGGLFRRLTLLKRVPAPTKALRRACVHRQYNTNKGGYSGTAIGVASSGASHGAMYWTWGMWVRLVRNWSWWVLIWCTVHQVIYTVNGG